MKRAILNALECLAWAALLLWLTLWSPLLPAAEVETMDLDENWN